MLVSLPTPKVLLYNWIDTPNHSPNHSPNPSPNHNHLHVPGQFRDIVVFQHFFFGAVRFGNQRVEPNEGRGKEGRGGKHQDGGDDGFGNLFWNGIWVFAVKQGTNGQRTQNVGVPGEKSET